MNMELVMAIFNMSESTANLINNVANVVTIIGAALVLIGTIAVVWSAGVKEQFSNEKIMDNKARVEVAQAEVEKAKEHAARLALETEKAKIEQQRLKAQLAWRRLNHQQFDVIKSDLVGVQFPDVWVTFVGDDPESNLFREDINSALTESGINTSYFSGYKMAVGLKIIGPDSEFKTKLVKAFKRAGLDFTVEYENGFSDGKLQILVGSKPPVF